MLKNCAFQYAKVGLNTTVVCDKTDLTYNEAVDLWNKYYSDAAKHIKSGGTVEMVIWKDMADSNSYNDYAYYIANDAESDGTRIWVTKKEYFPANIKELTVS